MTPLYKDAAKGPFYHIAIIALLGVGISAIPLDKLFGLFISDEKTALCLAQTVIRYIISAAAIITTVKYGFNKEFSFRKGVKGYIMVLPALLVAINNFPFVALFTGGLTPDYEGNYLILYIFYCLSIGLYEELVFRGLIFPLCLSVTENKKHGVFWAVALNAAIFGGIHIINLFGGASIPATVLQVGYSFLIGAMCAISFSVTGNVFVAVILHAVYDIGGLATSELGIFNGFQWDTLTVVLTAVLGVAVTAYMTVITFKLNAERVKIKILGEKFVTAEKAEIKSAKESERNDSRSENAETDENRNDR